MRHLGIVAKIAFICNLFFLTCILLQRIVPAGGTALVSVFAILGLVMGMGFFNPAANLLTLTAWLRYKKRPRNVPAWLAGANLFCLLLQIVYLLHTWS